MINRLNEDEMFDLTYRACVAAVGAGFPHLPIAAIIDPPHPWFDAAFARQIVLHLMIARFDIPKRRVDVDLRRSRDAIGRAMRVVDERLETPSSRRTTGRSRPTPKNCSLIPSVLRRPHRWPARRTPRLPARGLRSAACPSPTSSCPSACAASRTIMPWRSSRRSSSTGFSIRSRFAEPRMANAPTRSSPARTACGPSSFSPMAKASTPSSSAPTRTKRS